MGIDQQAEHAQGFVVLDEAHASIVVSSYAMVFGARARRTAAEAAALPILLLLRAHQPLKLARDGSFGFLSVFIAPDSNFQGALP